MIKKSTAHEIARLIGALTAEDAVQREAAAARLSVIGARAVAPLTAALENAGTSEAARIQALRVLEGLDDDRVLAPALIHLWHVDASVAVAAVPVARRFLSRGRSAAALDALTGVVLERTTADVVRIAALDALRDLPGPTIAPVLEQLRRDPSPAVRAAATRDATPAPEAAQLPPDGAAYLEIGANSGDAVDPSRLKAAIVVAGASAPLTTLHKLITAIRAREREAHDDARLAWAAARAAVHHVLASRGSRVALYDIRETLEEDAGPIPIEILAAAAEVGDASCLQAIAAAYVHESGARSRRRDGRDPWQQQQLAAAFRAIVAREKLTKRHAAVKRVISRWPDAVDALLAPPDSDARLL